MSDISLELQREIHKLKKQLSDALSQMNSPAWVMLAAPLTSTSWDGDSYSTAGKTLLDLSAVFGAPAGIKAALVRISINDSGSAAATTTCWIILSPNNTAGSGLVHRVAGIANDALHDTTYVVPCDANGDIYYQIDASGASTMDVRLEIWGYLI